jgi:hypothetical protein
MSNSNEQTSTLQQRFAEVFTRLPEQDIEQFYAHYQLWVLRQRVPFLEKQIETLREHIAENQQQIEALQPPAIALAVLARLQSKGVNDVALLDQMLERGEDWLDRMMQRLDYCEQVEDFIQGDYTQWCVNSLEGAYDWIDSLRDSSGAETTQPQETEPVAEADIQATEKLLLRKLSLDDEESMLETTLKQLAVQVEQPAESAAETEEQAVLESAETAAAAQAETLARAEGEMDEAGSSELQEAATESEIAREMSNWQDLESPEVRSAPWYSVDLEKDASLQSEQPEWIKALQEEDTARVEAGETKAAEENVSGAFTRAPAAEDEEPALLEQIAETSESEEQVAEPLDQDTQESISEPEEKPSPEENEPLIPEEPDTEREQESEAEQGEVSIEEETPTVEAEAAEQEVIAEPEEEPASQEGEAAEATASAQTGQTGEEGEAYTITISGEAAESELIDVTRAGEFLSITREEELPTETQTVEKAEPQTEKSELSTGVEKAEEPAEPAAEEEITEEIREAEPPAEGEEPLTTEEPELAEPSITEEAGQSDEQEVSQSPAGEVETQEAAQSPVGEETEQEASLPANEKVGQETQAVLANKTAEQNHEIEETAIAYDVLDQEGEQRAWYEYLELDEQGNIAPVDQDEEQGEPRDDDKTLPMALKEIRRAREQSVEIELAEPTAALVETEQAKLTNDSEQSEPGESADEAPTTAPAGDILAENKQAGSIEAKEVPLQPIQAAVPAPSPAPVAQPQEKRGFWQRLFGWLRGK